MLQQHISNLQYSILHSKGGGSLSDCATHNFKHAYKSKDFKHCGCALKTLWHDTYNARDQFLHKLNDQTKVSTVLVKPIKLKVSAATKDHAFILAAASDWSWFNRRLLL